jgi:hypothetical protein
VCCVEDDCTGGQDLAEETGGDNIVPEDWRYMIRECIRNPSGVIDRKVRRQALQYTVVGDELYRRSMDRLLLKCLGVEQAKVAMGEVHEGLCGTHQSVHKMRWMLKRAGFYWPSMIDDCFRYYQGCAACQRFGKI